MQEQAGRKRVIIIQTVGRSIVKRSEECGNRIRQAIGASEDRIAVWIRGLRPLPEETQFALADHLIDFDRWNVRDPAVLNVGIQEIVRKSVGIWTAWRREQRLDLYCD